MDIIDYRGTLKDVVDSLPLDLIEAAAMTIKSAKRTGNYVFTFGNGGSSSTASHLACDLAKSCGVKSLCLNDSTPLLTAWANDDDYSEVFAKQLDNVFSDGDVVVAISGSGNSKNVIKGVQNAKKKVVIVIGLSALGGGLLSKLADISIVAKTNNMEQAEDAHMVVCHLIKTWLLGEGK